MSSPGRPIGATTSVEDVGRVDDEDRLVRVDLVDHHLTQARFGVPANLMGAGLLLWTLWPMAHHDRLVVWYSMLALSQLAYACNNRLVRRDLATGRLHGTVVILPVVGALWGAGPFLVQAGALGSARASMVMVVTAGVAAASVVALAAFRSLFVVFSVPMLLLEGGGYALYGDSVMRIVVPAGAALLLALLVVYNHQAAIALSAAMRFRHRAALVAERREWEARHDVLTGLLNRGGLFQRADEVAHDAASSAGGYAFVFLDVDDFKRINDEGGHHVGDSVLREIADRLRRSCDPREIPARLGGDEFVVLVGGIATLAQAHTVAHRVRDAVQHPSVVDGREVPVSLSVGIALSADGTDEPSELLNAADRAMYRAKADGGAMVVVYDDALRRQTEEHMQLDRDLRAALERDEFVAHAQPVFDLATGEVHGVEVLVRWNRPGVGVLPAAAFIEAAERGGLAIEISRRMLTAAGVLATAWADDPELADLTIAVNIAARHLRHGVLVEDVRRAFAEHPLLRERLVLELTETEMVQNLADAVAALATLSADGVVVAIDDFGQGYSSLAYLNLLPARLVKIDRQFVSSITTDDGSRAVVEAAVGLAKAFGRDALAEGIETAADATAALALGCRYGQGYWYARPMPTEDVERFVRERTVARAASN